MAATMTGEPRAISSWPEDPTGLDLDSRTGRLGTSDDSQPTLFAAFGRRL
jgi:hypothetical protein